MESLAAKKLKSGISVKLSKLLIKLLGELFVQKAIMVLFFFLTIGTTEKIFWNNYLIG